MGKGVFQTISSTFSEKFRLGGVGGGGGGEWTPKKQKYSSNQFLLLWYIVYLNWGTMKVVCLQVRLHCEWTRNE